MASADCNPARPADARRTGVPAEEPREKHPPGGIERNGMPHESPVIAITADMFKARSFGFEKAARDFATEQQKHLRVDLAWEEVIDEVGNQTHWFVFLGSMGRRLYLA